MGNEQEVAHDSDSGEARILEVEKAERLKCAGLKVRLQRVVGSPERNPGAKHFSHRRVVRGGGFNYGYHGPFHGLRKPWTLWRGRPLGTLSEAIPIRKFTMNHGASFGVKGFSRVPSYGEVQTKKCSRAHFPILSRDPSFQKTIRTPGKPLVFEKNAGF